MLPLAGALALTRSILVGLACGAALTACHRSYEVRGSVTVVPTAARKARLPAVLCTGYGGSLDWALVHGHPVQGLQETGKRWAPVIYCSEPRAEDIFPVRESIYYGSMPRRAHVYAWLAPVPVAESLCAEAGTDIVEVRDSTLYELKLRAQAQTRRADPEWPCGHLPPSVVPMTSAVTFDPDHPTWDASEGARWIEHRSLRLE
jgi:hypothetical protein